MNLRSDEANDIPTIADRPTFPQSDREWLRLMRQFMEHPCYVYYVGKRGGERIALALAEVCNDVPASVQGVLSREQAIGEVRGLKYLDSTMQEDLQLLVKRVQENERQSG